MSPDCKSCKHACKKACASSCLSGGRNISPMMHHRGGISPMMYHHGGKSSPNCMLVKRCTSPKPKPIPGCKWVKTCSPIMSGGIMSGGIMSPRRHRFHHRRSGPRRISPYSTTVIGGHHPGPRKISPYSTTVIGRHGPKTISPTIFRR